MHIDEFIDSPDTNEYASWFFLLHRQPATLKMKFSKYINALKLFCIYEGKQYRVTGCSRMGDVWITSNFDQDTGYEKRVNVLDCKQFSESL